jgi:phosphoglucosamine mutase
VVFSDASGQVVDGDAILAVCGLDLKRRDALHGDAVVATVMSNLGLERCLDGHGVRLVRTPVGDRYVVETMRARGFTLGGEQSGHLVFLEHSTTGDGTLAALQVLAIMVRSGASLADLARVMTRYPQVSRKVVVERKTALEQLPATSRAIASAEGKLGRDGRVLVRYSGTEPVLRVMLEGPDLATIDALADDIASAAAQELAGAHT